MNVTILNDELPFLGDGKISNALCKWLKQRFFVGGSGQSTRTSASFETYKALEQSIIFWFCEEVEMRFPDGLWASVGNYDREVCLGNTYNPNVGHSFPLCSLTEDAKVNAPKKMLQSYYFSWSFPVWIFFGFHLVMRFRMTVICEYLNTSKPIRINVTKQFLIPFFSSWKPKKATLNFSSGEFSIQALKHAVICILDGTLRTYCCCHFNDWDFIF